ncbi:MAG: hypothetical protein DI534_11930 [Leifsonia xyli]|nr:MAG: hypothetical protein DI534_11930 [Leifsonia xyli]
MANTLYTAEQAVEILSVIASADLNLAATISRDVEVGFQPGSGLTVHVRIPGSTKASTKDPSDTTTAIGLGSIVEQTVPVTLTKNVASRVPLSEADLSLNLKDFGKQVLRPQAASLVEDVEQAVADVMQDTPLTTLAYDAANPAKLFTLARAELRSRGVNAQTPLLAAVGAGVYGALLDGPERTFDANGTVRGFTVLESTRLAADEAIFYVKNAFALALRAPEAPDAPFAASVKAESENGSFAARLVRAFSTERGVEESLVNVLRGVRSLPLPVLDPATGATDLVEHGGAIRVDTSA